MKKNKSTDYKTRFSKLNKKSKNNVICIQNTELKVSDIEDSATKEMLSALYETATDAKESALATICKGILIQGKAFLSLSRDSLNKAIAKDPDNTFKSQTKLCRLTAHLAHYGIFQLWDSKFTGARKAAGFAVENSDILALLGLEKEDLLSQFRELKNFCENEDLNSSLIFDSSSGEIRLQKEEIRKLILDKRKKIQESGDMKLESSDEICELGEKPKVVAPASSLKPRSKFGSKNTSNKLYLYEISNKEEVKNKVITFFNQHSESFATLCKKAEQSELIEYIQSYLPKNMSNLSFVDNTDLVLIHAQLMETFSVYKEFENSKLIVILNLVLGTNISGGSCE